jgi:hypothetical protein
MTNYQKRFVIPINGANVIMKLGDGMGAEMCTVLTTVPDRTGELHVVLDYAHGAKEGEPFLMTLKEFAHCEKNGRYVAKTAAQKVKKPKMRDGEPGPA